MRHRARLSDRAGRMAWVAGPASTTPGPPRRRARRFEEVGEEVAKALVDRSWPRSTSRRARPPLRWSAMTPHSTAIERVGSPADVAELAAQLGRFLVFTDDYDRAAASRSRSCARREAQPAGDVRPGPEQQIACCCSISAVRMSRGSAQRSSCGGARARPARRRRCGRSTTWSPGSRYSMPLARRHRDPSARRSNTHSGPASACGSSRSSPARTGGLDFLGRWDEALERGRGRRALRERRSSAAACSSGSAVDSPAAGRRPARARDPRPALRCRPVGESRVLRRIRGCRGIGAARRKGGAR